MNEAPSSGSRWSGSPHLRVLFDASMGFRVRNATYRISAGVIELVASRDLQLLVERGLLEATGE